jgi:RNA polymerase primary sigma factor
MTTISRTHPVRPVRPVVRPIVMSDPAATPWREMRERQAHATASGPDRLGVSAQQMERERAAALAHGDLVGMLHAEAAAHALLSADEELALARRMRGGAPDERAAARAAFIAANIRLVGSIARYYVRSGRQVRGQLRRVNARRQDGLDLDDLMAEGLVGLIRAVDKFDPERGCRFSTHASWWIRQAIARGIVDRGYAISAPAYQRARERLVLRLRQQFESAHGHRPTVAELARLADLTEAQVTEALGLPGARWSLDAATGATGAADAAEEPLTLAGALPDVRAADALEAVEVAADAVGPHSVTTIMARLAARSETAARQMEILRWRYVDGETLEWIGQRLGVSHERVRQLSLLGERRVREERARLRRAGKAAR